MDRAISTGADADYAIGGRSADDRGELSTKKNKVIDEWIPQRHPSAPDPLRSTKLKLEERIMLGVPRRLCHTTHLFAVKSSNDNGGIGDTNRAGLADAQPTGDATMVEDMWTMSASIEHDSLEMAWRAWMLGAIASRNGQMNSV